MPESLLAALQRLGHQVDSVNNLKLKALLAGLSIVGFEFREGTWRVTPDCQ